MGLDTRLVRDGTYFIVEEDGVVVGCGGWSRRAPLYADSEATLAEVRAKRVITCRELWQAVDARLGAGPWAIGERYTVADAYLLVFWTWGHVSVLGFDMARDFPDWTAHARRMAARPAVQRAFRREGLALPV